MIRAKIWAQYTSIECSLVTIGGVGETGPLVLATSGKGLANCCTGELLLLHKASGRKEPLAACGEDSKGYKECSRINNNQK